MKDPTKLSTIDIQLRQSIQGAVLEVGRVSGTDRTELVNTDVIDALLDVCAAFASMHGFENYTPRHLADKYTRGLANRIEAYRRMTKPSNMKIVPRFKGS